jgi:carbon monoxide dehydrogenase subunit G
MQVKLEKTVSLQSNPEAAWQLLQDVPRVAECMPGARITEQLDDSRYRGEVRVKIGPASATFKGDVEVKRIDPAQHELQLLGKGKDTRGTSSATMDLTATLRTGANGQTELVGVSAVSVTGKLASFGGRMMNQVADQLLDQFATNFSARLTAGANGTAPAAAGNETAAAGQPGELNALALLWRALLGYLKDLFRHKTGTSG